MRGHIFFFQAEDGIRDYKVTGVQTCALPIFPARLEVALHHRALVGGQAPAVRAEVAALCVVVAHAVPELELLGKGMFEEIADGVAVQIEFVPSRLSDEAVAGNLSIDRSEERRVGKECRSRWSP